MAGCLRVKDGVEFSLIAPGGFRILSALETTARKLGVDLWITSGSDGEHSGPLDPHKLGKAYDVRSHDFADDFKAVVLNCLQALLPSDQFYCFLENPGAADEHWHCQVRKGTEYP